MRAHQLIVDDLVDTLALFDVRHAMVDAGRGKLGPIHGTFHQEPRPQNGEPLDAALPSLVGNFLGNVDPRRG